MSYGPRAEWNLATRQANWGSCRVSKRSASTSPGWSARPKITGKTSVHSRVAPAFDSRLKVSLINKAKFSCQNWLIHANKGLKIIWSDEVHFMLFCWSIICWCLPRLKFTWRKAAFHLIATKFSVFFLCFFYFLLWFTLLTTLTNTFIYTIYNNYKIYNFVSPLHYQQNYLTIQLLTHYLQYNAITGVTYNDTIASLTLQNKVQCA